MNALVMLAVMVLPYAGELGWVDGATKTCLYKIPNTSRLFVVTLPRQQPCPTQVEIRNDDPKPTEETRAARYTF